MARPGRSEDTSVPIWLKLSAADSAKMDQVLARPEFEGWTKGEWCLEIIQTALRYYTKPRPAGEPGRKRAPGVRTAESAPTPAETMAPPAETTPPPGRAAAPPRVRPARDDAGRPPPAAKRTSPRREPEPVAPERPRLRQPPEPEQPQPRRAPEPEQRRPQRPAEPEPQQSRREPESEPQPSRRPTKPEVRQSRRVPEPEQSPSRRAAKPKPPPPLPQPGRGPAEAGAAEPGRPEPGRPESEPFDLAEADPVSAAECSHPAEARDYQSGTCAACGAILWD
jgi:hypothetical protein